MIARITYEATIEARQSFLYKVSFDRWTSNGWQTFRRQASLETKDMVFKPESRAFRNGDLLYLNHNITRYRGPAMELVI